jgi:hypothetical protein
MSDLQPCGMCGAPWAQMVQDRDEELEALKAAARAVLVYHVPANAMDRHSKALALLVKGEPNVT